MCPLNKTFHVRAAADRRGFALLITITLLAFLVLLLVSLASLTQVETQVASNTQQLSKARANALLGLNVALGQLQHYAGPDQRATSRPSGASSAGAGMWTGVWGNSLAATDARSAPALLNWLVSGNEKAVFSTDTSASPTFGQVTAATGITYQPGQTVSGLSVGDTTAASTNLQINNSPAVLLVGPNTVGTTGPDVVNHFVVAPLVDLKVPDDVIPGLSGGGESTVGHYAYWIGDEGVKAKLNTLDPYAPRPATSDANYPQLPAYAPSVEAARNRHLMPQRLGIELVSKSAPGTAADPLGSPAYNVTTETAASAHFRRDLSKLNHYESLSLVQGYAAGFGPDFNRYRYHDLTTTSAGVLADSLRGGLKKDLTTYFNFGDVAVPAGYKSADLAFPVSYITPQAPSATTGLPKFGLIKSFYDIRTEASGLVPEVSVRANVAGTTQGIHPVVTRAQIAVTASFFKNDAGLWCSRLHIWPIVVLWNPYNARLKAADYTINLTFTVHARVWLKDGTGGTPVEVGNFDFKTLSPTSGAPQFAFQLPAQGFEPGEALMCTAETYAPYAAGARLAPRYNTLSSYTVDLAAIVPQPVTTTNLFAIVSAGNTGGAPSESAGVGFGPSLRLSSTDEVISEFRTFQNFPSSGGVAKPGGTLHNYAFTDSTAAPPSAPNYPASAFRLPFVAMGVIQIRGRFDRAQTQRIIANHNVRAPLVEPAPTEVNANARAWIWLENSAPGLGWPWLSGRNFPLGSPSFVTRTAGVWQPSLGEWALAGTETAPLLPMFEVPRSDFAVGSLGILQHLMFSPKRWHPSYIFGNSLADARIKSENTGGAFTDGTNAAGDFTDWSYVLNRSLWDRFFLSTVPPTLTAAQLADPEQRLPNARLMYHPGRESVSLTDLRHGGGGDPFRRAAAVLTLDGAFNINSTSVEAWRAVLGALRDVIPQNASGDAVQNGFIHPYGRYFAHPAGNVPVGATADRTTAWKRNRFLTDAEINELAAAVVAEIRARQIAQGGPFLSLADFINRRLENGSTPASIKGALQAAIDATSINAGLTASNFEATATGFGGVIDAHSLGSTATGIPGYLTQADVLQAIAPALAPRSDTFTIRAYGDIVNPVTEENEGRAWCEAVVQRLPDYVESAGDAPETEPTALTVQENKTMGRRFHVVKFRWLAAEDI